MMIRMVGGWVFLLVPAHPGSHGQRVVKWLLLCCCLFFKPIVLFSDSVLFIGFQEGRFTHFVLYFLVSQMLWFLSPFCSPSPLVNNIWAAVIVRTVTKKTVITVLCGIAYYSCVQWYVWTVFKVECWFKFWFSWDFGLLFVCFCHFVPMLLAFVVLGLVSSVLSQEIS